MAGLNLMPNPTVLAVQTGIFLTALVTVKKLFLEPYLKVREQREKATLGNKSSAADLIAQNEKQMAELDSRMEAAQNEFKKLAEAERQTAVSKRDSLVSSAEAEAKKTIEEMRSRIAQELEAEKAKVPEVVTQLTSQIFSQAVH